MTIEKFDAIVRKDTERRESLSAEINELMQKENELEAAAQKEAEAGDVDAYLEKMNEKNKIAAAILVKRTCLDKLPKLGLKNEAREAWEDYAGNYDKKLKKALADFKAEKEKLLKMYSDMVDLQKEALSVRKHLSVAAEENEGSFPMEFIPCRSGASSYGLLSLGGYICKDADVCYFLADYCEKNNTNIVDFSNPSRIVPVVEKITNVVVNHRA